MDRVHIGLGILILLGVALGFGGEWLSPGSGRATPRTASAVPVTREAAQTSDSTDSSAPGPPQPPLPVPALAAAPAPASPAATLVGESAVVDNTEGLGLLLRTTADLSAESVASLLDGAGVEVLETTVLGDTRWYLVRHGDLRGWVRAQFLRRP